MRKSQFELGHSKPEVARSALRTGARGKTYCEGVKAEKGDSVIGHSLKSYWLFVIGPP